MSQESLKEGEVLLSRYAACRGLNSDEDDEEVEFTQIELREQNGQVPGQHGPAGPIPPWQSTCYLLTASVMASLGGILFGYDIGIISGALLQLKEKFCLSCLDQEMVVSSMLLGAMLGSVFGGFLIDRYGRRFTIIVNAVIFLVGALILALAPNFPVLIIGRIVVGFAVSVSATGECIYISEIAPAKRRGLFVSLNELGITLGILMAYLVGFMFIGRSDGWRYMFGISAIPAIIQGIGMMFLPPSPRYLMLKKNEEKAEEILCKLRGTTDVNKELTSIRISIASDKTDSCLTLFSSVDNMRGRMMVGIVLVFFQQFTGQPNVLYYAPTIFQTIGFESQSAATLATVGLGVVKVIFTVIALCSVDQWGRRKFLLLSAAVMGVAILVLGIVTKLEHHNIRDYLCHIADNCNPDLTNLTTTMYPTNTTYSSIHGNSSVLLDRSITHVTNPFNLTAENTLVNPSTTELPNYDTSDMLCKIASLAALMIYVAAFAIGFGPVTWLILSEIFPAAVKGRAIAMATIFNWGTNLIVSFSFLDLMRSLGTSGTFGLFSVMCFLSLVFIFSFVPETKSRTLEQVSADLKKRPPCVRMKQNCQSLCCCYGSTLHLRIQGNYSQVHDVGAEAETIG